MRRGRSDGGFSGVFDESSEVGFVDWFFEAEFVTSFFDLKGIDCEASDEFIVKARKRRRKEERLVVPAGEGWRGGISGVFWRER